MQEQDVIKTSQKYITGQILKIKKNGKKIKKRMKETLYFTVYR